MNEIARRALERWRSLPPGASTRFTIDELKEVMNALSQLDRDVEELRRRTDADELAVALLTGARHR